MTLDLRHLYGNPISHFPLSVVPKQHTMHHSDFVDYIQHTKFSDEQKLLLEHASGSKWQIRVFGAYLSHLDHLIGEHKVRIVDRKQRTKPGNFNRYRPEFIYVESIDSQRRPELWIIAFPSKEYVSQVAELVQAILDQADSGQNVIVTRFPNCESELGTWSRLETELQQYVREGDVVVLGNVDLLKDQLLTLGFRDRFGDWRPLGLDSMYAISSMIHSVSNRRLLLLGAIHTFWGSASAKIVQAAIRCGARHVLYCSKAGNLIRDGYIHQVIAPTAFLVATHSAKDGWTCVPIDLNSARGDFTHAIAKSFGFSQGGFHLTVPTVISETLEQVKAYEPFSPATIDNEDGYIAQVVADANKSYANSHTHIKFVPLHFITDYLRASDREAPPSSSLGVHSEEEKRRVRSQRDEAFYRMASFTAMYAVVHGVVDRLFLELTVTSQSSDEERRAPVRATIPTRAEQVEPYIDNNHIEIAIDLHRAMRPLADCDRESLREIAIICQKEGLLEDAMLCLEHLKSLPAYSIKTEPFRHACRVLELKVNSQSGYFDKVLSSFQEVLDETVHLEVEKSLRCPILHRAAVAAGLSGRATEAENLFASSREWAKRFGLDHAKASCGMFEVFALAIHGDKIGAEDALSRLKEVQEQYLFAEVDRDAWQRNVIRAFAEALAGEAVLFLMDRDPVRKRPGLARIAIFQLITRYCGANERSEALSELVYCCKNYPDVQRTLRLAMDPMRPFFAAHSNDAALNNQIMVLVRDFASFPHWPAQERFNRTRTLLESIDSKLLS